MKEFKSKGISLENMVGAEPMKEKKVAGTPGKAYNQTIVLTEDLVWELRTFAADHRYRGVKTVRTGHWTATGWNSSGKNM